MGATSEVFKAYDIRGTVPDQLDATMVRAIGGAFARFSAADRIVVGRDMRASGADLSAAFAKGARARGCTVVDVGMVSTDCAYFASGALDAPTAMFTASHNPAAYNGVKLCLAGARPIGRDTGLKEIEEMTNELLATPDPIPEALAPLEHRDVLGDFAAHVRSFVDVSALRGLRVVADTANGMGGLVVPAVMDGLPFDVEILYEELDGTFPNHPADPIQEENLEDLRAAVRSSGADVGLAFDGDADRVFLVDERGEPVSGSLTTALVASAMLDKYPGATVLYNCICSKTVPEVIAEHGGTGIRTRVGHSFIKAVMAETGAVFGGEHSGHYYYRENYRADSGIITALVVLELMSKSHLPLSEMLAPYRRYVSSGELNSPVEDPAATVEEVAAHEARQGLVLDRLDGLTVDHATWWYNLRPSNTEPLLRLNVEARDEAACASHVEEVEALVRAAVHALR